MREAEVRRLDDELEQKRALRELQTAEAIAGMETAAMDMAASKGAMETTLQRELEMAQRHTQGQVAAKKTQLEGLAAQAERDRAEQQAAARRQVQEAETELGRLQQHNEFLRLQNELEARFKVEELSHQCVPCIGYCGLGPPCPTLAAPQPIGTRHLSVNDACPHTTCCFAPVSTPTCPPGQRAALILSHRCRPRYEAFETSRMQRLRDAEDKARRILERQGTLSQRQQLVQGMVNQQQVHRVVAEQLESQRAAEEAHDDKRGDHQIRCACA